MVPCLENFHMCNNWSENCREANDSQCLPKTCSPDAKSIQVVHFSAENCLFLFWQIVGMSGLYLWLWESDLITLTIIEIVQTQDSGNLRSVSFCINKFQIIHMSDTSFSSKTQGLHEFVWNLNSWTVLELLGWLECICIPQRFQQTSHHTKIFRMRAGGS